MMVAVTEEKKHGHIPYPKPVPEKESVKVPVLKPVLIPA